MASHIPLITQDEFGPNQSTETESTMGNNTAHPNLITHDYATTNPISSKPKKTQFQLSSTKTKKQFLQRTLDGKICTHHLTKAVSVRSHKRKSPCIKAHTHSIKKHKFASNDECKASRSLAITLHVEEVRNLMKRK
jgi:hypothetical protein